MGTAPAEDLNRTAFQATVHCLTGCAIGEVSGLVISTLLGLAVLPAIVLSIALSFVFGYGLTMRPLLASGMAVGSSFRIALASDSVSLITMEATDNAVVLAVPGAMTAGLTDWLFWGSLALSLVIAFVVALPVNRWLIRRGLGHAVVPHGPHGSAAGH
jgi:Domain of unknown function (DUF4396)